MREQRQALAARGLQAPGDLERQEALLAGLERMQAGFPLMSAVVIAILVNAILTCARGVGGTRQAGAGGWGREHPWPNRSNAARRGRRLASLCAA
jgi:hypothetical protein